MKIEELRKLSNDATSGPWNYSTCYGIATIEAKDNEAIAHAVDYLEKSDAQFITESRNHFDALLDVAEAAKKSRMCVANCASYYFVPCDCGHVDIKRALKKLEQGE